MTAEVTVNFTFCSFISVQVLAGGKLTFVAVAGTGLCFGFVMNT